MSLKNNFKLGHSYSTPMAVLVHGRSGNINVMSSFNRTVPNSWHILTLEAPWADPRGGYSWWDIGAAPNELQEQGVTNAQLLADAITSCLNLHGLTSECIVGVGFSQGGAMLSLLPCTTDLRLSGIAYLASFMAPLEWHWEELLASTQWPRSFVAHGLQDTVVLPEIASKSCEFLKGRGVDVELHLEPVGHKIGSASFKALGAWLERFTDID